MKRPNIYILLSICVLVFLEVLFLRPSKIESDEQDPQGMFNSIETQVLTEKKEDSVAYTIDGFHYTAVEGEEKQWEMDAKQALLYEKSRMARAYVAKILMFDQKGRITFIEGDEAFFRFGSQDLDLVGNVKVTFPDGFWIKTSKAFYRSAIDEVSTTEAFYGEAVPNAGELMQMWGIGFRAKRSESTVYVLKDSRVKMRRLSSDEITDVRSDFAQIDRFLKVAEFTMADPKRFVETDRGTLNVKSRRQVATYNSKTSALQVMTAYDDVLIREQDPLKSKKGMKYATCQKADFLTQEDKILLSGFPSVYQEKDTLTGELITIYRKRNIVEVMQANALHDPADDETVESAPSKR